MPPTCLHRRLVVAQVFFHGTLADEADQLLIKQGRLVHVRRVAAAGDHEEAALGRAVEVAAEYEDDYETDEGEAGTIRFEGIVAIKELDDPPAAGTEVWHEFMTPDPSRPVADGEDGEPLPPVYPEAMAFPRAHDD